MILNEKIFSCSLNQCEEAKCEENWTIFESACLVSH